MKIAIVRQRYSPHGGAEKFVSRALSALCTDQLAVSLLARKWESVGGVDFVPCDPFYLGRIWRDWSFARRVCHTVAEMDVDLVQSHERIECCDLYRAGDGVHMEWLKQKSRALRGLEKSFHAISPYHHYVKRAEKKMFESPSLRAVICNSEMVKKEISQYFQIAEEKLHVIYSGVDKQQFSPDLKKYRKNLRTELDIPQSATLFAFVGSGFFRKGLQQVLQAMVALDKNNFLVVAGYDKKLSQYQAMAKRLGIADRIRFLGSVNDVKPCYGAADAFILPTLYDPFPNAVLEAFAVGLPVITSEKSGAAEVIRQGENGYVCDALDIKSLSLFMHKLNDVHHRAEMGKQARETADQFDMNQMVQRLTELYQQLNQ